MLGGGEFIINGAERVVVNQLHRSPGVDFVMEMEGTGDRRLHSCRIIPERGSWIELNVTRKESLAVRIDQSGKFSIMTLLRAMDPKYSDDAALLRIFYETERVKVVDGRSVGENRRQDRRRRHRLSCRQSAGRRGPRRGRPEDHQKRRGDDLHLRPDGSRGDGRAEEPAAAQRLGRGRHGSHEEALLRIYQRLRPGNPPQLEKAKALFHEKFYDTNRYRLGRVGRFRINRKLGLKIPEDEMTLRPDDLIAAIRLPGAAARQRAGGGNRRHRPPGQPPPADDRRVGQRRAAQGLPQAPPHGAGADEPQGRRGHDAAEPGQSRRAFRRPSSTFSAAASFRRWSTRPTRCRCSPTSGGFRPWARAA